MQHIFLKENFQSPTDGRVTLMDVMERIKGFIEEDPTATYNLVVGSDSHERQEPNGQHYIHVITAIVVHRQGFGGKYFWYKSKKILVHSLREKIYAETIQSLDIAREFVPMLTLILEDISAKYSLEIHVDVGEAGETREMIREVVGMVTGYGYIAKTKPDSYAATYVADKHT